MMNNMRNNEAVYNNKKFEVKFSTIYVYKKVFAAHLAHRELNPRILLHCKLPITGEH